MLNFNKINKDKRYRYFFSLQEKKVNLHKYLIYNSRFNLNIKYLARWSLIKTKNNLNFTKIKNRCIFTGRSKGIVSKFKVSRHVFKLMVNSGHINNIKKK